MPWMRTEMPPLTPTASCSGASTSAAAAVAVSVRLRKMARRSVSYSTPWLPFGQELPVPDSFD